MGGFTTGMAFDAGQNLHVTNFSVNSLSTFNNQGVLQAGTCCPGSGSPESVTVNNAGNRIVTYVAGGIRTWNSAGVQQGATVLPGTRADFGDLAADQTTFIFGQEGNRILSVNLSTGVAGPDFSNSVINAFAMRILADGRVLVADRDNVKLLDTDGSVIGTYDVTGEDTWFALNLNPGGTSFWSGNFGTGNLYEFDIETGTHLDDFTQTIGTGAAGAASSAWRSSASGRRAARPATSATTARRRHWRRQHGRSRAGHRASARCRPRRPGLPEVLPPGITAPPSEREGVVPTGAGEIPGARGLFAGPRTESDTLGSVGRVLASR